MKKRQILPLIVAVIALVAVSACSSTQTTGEEFNDATITAKIKSKLTAHPDVNAFNIDVDTLDRVVTLSGQVEYAEARRAAEEVAWDTYGVRDVVNRLEVVGPRD